ncbi:hypothetical protein AS591_20295 [Stenotrophomonas maltophilia]|nr:hypothetical protein AS591_20295 [Stenotrophomonas maltophilia]
MGGFHIYMDTAISNRSGYQCHHHLELDFTLYPEDGDQWEEAKANARLIAAAPELLDALIEAVECGMVPISSAKDGGASTHSRQVRCADMIRAAIAKATGGAQ